MARVTSCRLLAAAAIAALPASARAQQLVYTSLNPCRIVDTRLAAGGALAAGTPRTFHVVGSASDFAAQGGLAGGCGIPGFTGPIAGASAVVFNFVAVNPQGAGHLKAWATGQPEPNAAVLNFVGGQTIANGIVVPVRQDSEGDDVTVGSFASGAHLVVDVVGYFKPLAIVAPDLPVVPISRGGTGATVQTFVDLSAAQSVGGAKTFTGNVQVSGALTTGSPALVPIVGQDANMRVVRGVISGATCSVQLGTGFSCIRNGVGNYTITFTPAFTGIPVPVVMPVLTTLIQSLTVNSSSMNLQTVNTSNVATDSIFTLIVVGPR